MRSIFGAFFGLQLWIMLRSALLLLRLPAFSGNKQRTPAFDPRLPTPGLRVLVTGRVDSKNWCMAHLLPLSQTANISELLLVVDGEVPGLPKARQFLIPKQIGWFRPRAIVRSAWAVVVALQQKPDIVMGYSFFPPGLFALMAARLTGAAAIVQLTGGVLEIESGGHASDHAVFPQFMRKRLVPLCHRICRHFDAVIVRGRKAEAYLREHLQPKRVEIIPGSVDPARFHIRNERRKIDIVFIGRIVPVKQPDHIVEILKRVTRKRPGLRAVIAGRGPLLEPMKRQVSAQGLVRNVFFAGHVERVEGLLARSRIFLLTSRSEGLSIALAEAMLAGAVPIVANVGDLSELVINAQTGWLIKPGDFEAYADKICELLEDEPAREKLSNEARRIAFDNNGVEAVVHRWQSCLPEIVESVCRPKIDGESIIKCA